MKDISPIIKEIVSKDILWSISIFYQVIEKVEAKVYQVSFWDGEENWATLIYEKTTIGYLWKRYPLLFILSDFAAQIHTCLKEFDFIAIVRTNRLEEKGFKVDFNLLKNEFNLSINLEKFSAEDLWFSTNSN